jgi:hypothetical protein
MKIKMIKRKCAIVSFILGIINVSLVALLSFGPGWISELLLKNQYLTYGSVFIFSIIGIILGIIGTKSERKMFALSGLILSVIIFLRLIPVVIFIFFYNP